MQCSKVTGVLNNINQMSSNIAHQGEPYSMKILWITNWPFPEVSKNLGLPVFLSQGWLLNLAANMAKSAKLSVICISQGISSLQQIEISGIKHFVLPAYRKFSKKSYAPYYEKIVSDVQPDIVHIFGTEFSHGNEFVHKYPDIPCVLTIQGLMSRISEEYYGGLKLWDIIKYRTLRENLRLGGMYFIKKQYEKQAKLERDTLQHVDYVTGRTLWDRSVLYAINRGIKYVKCNWNLRDQFYKSDKWDLARVKRHSIYTCFASYPLKGLHILLRAVALLKDQYQDIMINVPGVQGDADGRIIADTGYKRYLKDLIKTLNIEQHVNFIGAQSAEQVIDSMLQSNLIVIPSAIEGDSLVALEGQYVGVPLICSYRGGMTDLFDNGVDGFYYDFAEYPFLAQRIKQLFDDDDLCKQFSLRGIKRGESRSNANNNTEAYMKVYRDAIEECNEKA